MSPGPEHYREAERLLTAGVAVVTEIRAAHDEARRDALGKQAMGIWAQAQAHATLALAAASAMNFPVGDGMSQSERRAWREVAGTQVKAGLLS